MTSVLLPQADPHDGYRPCVGIMLFNRDGKVFIGQRRVVRTQPDPESLQGHWTWQMPQGGIDAGEPPHEAALRELYEETGIRSVRLIAESPHWYGYDLPGDLAGRWGGRYRGQTQKWFALNFEGQDNEIDVEHPGGGHHTPEFDAWRWENPARLVELIVPFKRPIYEQVVALFCGPEHETGLYKGLPPNP